MLPPVLSAVARQAAPMVWLCDPVVWLCDPMHGNGLKLHGVKTRLALVLTPTYHLFRMTKGHQDATSLRVDTPAGIPTRDVDGKQLPTISVTASRKNGRLLISLSNLDAGAGQDVEIDLRGARTRA